MKIMRWVSTFPLRVRTLFRKKRVEQELGEELKFHLDRQVEVLMEQGLSANDAHRAAMKEMGAMSVERQMEKCRDVRAWQWMEILRTDVRFGWRQLMKNKVTTATAILSLGLAVGACVSAFRLIDALLLRPLPVAHAERLYVLSRTGFDPRGKPNSWDGWAYPDFALMRDAAKNEAELIAVSYTERMDLTYATDEEMEKGYVQYVSGWMFDSFGLRPALGRLLTKEDDLTPGAHPYAVFSYDYWTRRFGRDPKVIGRMLRMGDTGVRDRGRWSGALYRYGAGDCNRDLSADDDEPLGDACGRDLASDAGDCEPGSCHGTAAGEAGYSQPELRDGAGQGIQGYVASSRSPILSTNGCCWSRQRSGVSVLQDDYRRALTWLRRVGGVGAARLPAPTWRI